MDGWNTTFLLGRELFRGHVKLRGGNFLYLSDLRFLYLYLYLSPVLKVSTDRKLSKRSEMVICLLLSEVWEKKKHLMIGFSATVMVFLFEHGCKCWQLECTWSVEYCSEHVFIINLSTSIFHLISLVGEDWGNWWICSASLGCNNLGILGSYTEKKLRPRWKVSEMLVMEVDRSHPRNAASIY